MEKNQVFAKAMVHWHTGMRVYYEQLLECCLDTITKAKLQQKIHYHQMKLQQLM